MDFKTEKINQLSQQYGFSSDAVAHMWTAMANGNGTMAQFNHFEFGGMGQWLQGGMLMIGDMFNNYLKGQVDGLCYAMAPLVVQYLNSPQYQQAQAQQRQAMQWWPSEYGQPNASGSQNNTRYAYFAHARRMVVEINGVRTIYDTGDHQIGGFSQQQSVTGEFSFQSQFGSFYVSALRAVTQ